jgi:hypothetical protein
MKLKTRQITDVFVEVTFPYYCTWEGTYYKFTQIKGRNSIKVECVRQKFYSCEIKPDDHNFTDYLIAFDDADGVLFESLLDDYRKALEPWTYSVTVFRGENQKVNEVDAGARVTCIETGKVTECSKHRSYYQNLYEARRMLNEKVV